MNEQFMIMLKAELDKQSEKTLDVQLKKVAEGVKLEVKIDEDSIKGISNTIASVVEGFKGVGNSTSKIFAGIDSNLGTTIEKAKTFEEAITKMQQQYKKGIIDEKEYERKLKGQLYDKSGQLNKHSLKLEPKVLDKYIDQLKMIQDINSMGRDIESQGFKVSKLTSSFDMSNGEKLKRTITEYKNEWEETVRIVKVMNTQTGNLVSVDKTITDNLEKRNKELLKDQEAYQKLLDKQNGDSDKGFAQAEKRKRDILQKESDMKSKIYEEEEKQKLKLIDFERQLGTVREQALSKVSMVSKDYEGFINQSDLDIVKQGLKSMSADTNNLETDVEALKKEMKEYLDLLEQATNLANKDKNKAQLAQLKKDEEELKIKKKLLEYQKELNEEKDKAKAKIDTLANGSLKGFYSEEHLQKISKKFESLNVDTENLSTNTNKLKQETRELVKELDRLEGEAYNNKGLSVGAIIDHQIASREAEAKMRSKASKAFFEDLERQERAQREVDEKKHKRLMKEQDLTLKLQKIKDSNDIIDTSKYADLEKRIKKIGVEADITEQEIEELVRELNRFSHETRVANGKTETLGSMLSKVAVRYFGFYEVVNLAKIGIRSMIREIIELDTSLVELQKVTDLTGNSLDAFVEKSFRMGEEIGKTGKEVIDAVTTFSKAGYTMEQSLGMGKDALIMTNVAEGITDVQDASGALISVIKGYGMEVSSTTHLVDAFNEVSNTMAVNFDDLVEGARRISGVMNQQGNSFEEMLGMITGGTEILRVTNTLRM